jgi:hypothetical protein
MSIAIGKPNYKPNCKTLYFLNVRSLYKREEMGIFGFIQFGKVLK